MYLHIQRGLVAGTLGFSRSELSAGGVSWKCGCVDPSAVTAVVSISVIMLTVTVVIAMVIDGVERLSEALFNADSLVRNVRNIGRSRRRVHRAPHSLRKVASICVPVVGGSFPRLSIRRCVGGAHSLLQGCFSTIRSGELNIVTRRIAPGFAGCIRKVVSRLSSITGARRCRSIGVCSIRVTHCVGGNTAMAVLFRTSINCFSCIASVGGRIAFNDERGEVRAVCRIKLVCIRSTSQLRGETATLKIGYPGYNTPMGALKRGFYRFYKATVGRVGVHS